MRIFSGKYFSLFIAILGFLSLGVAIYLLVFYLRSGDQWRLFRIGVFIIIAVVVTVNNYRRYRRLDSPKKDRKNSAGIT